VIGLVISRPAISAVHSAFQYLFTKSNLLLASFGACYGFRLSRSQKLGPLEPLIFPNISRVTCHEVFGSLLILLLLTALVPVVPGQVSQDPRAPLGYGLGVGPGDGLIEGVRDIYSPPQGGPQQAVAAVRIPRITTLSRNELQVVGVTQTHEGEWFRLRGAAQVETVDALLRADEIDYNEATGYVEARGNASYESFDRGEEIQAERIEYWLRENTGKFYVVRGSAPTKIEYRPGLLTTNNPFVFQGKWAERLKDRYILHDGFVTNCRLPNPWWVLRGPKFDIIPGDRAIAYQPWFRLRGIPLFYTPAFYKSLEEQPRRSGFLMPNIGNSSRRGMMFGIGYFWAINRSYDTTYRAQYFTQRGLAHHVDFRGKPWRNSDFNTIFYGVQDRGELQEDGTRIKQGGYMIAVTGKTDLPAGFYAQGEINYLSSFVFRQAFTETFNEAVNNEVHSRGFVRKDWAGESFNVVFERSENYQSTNEGDRISIRKLPQMEFRARERELFRGVPVWVSLESAAGLMRRNQPLFQTRKFVERLDLAPRVMTALRWKEFTLLPYAAIRETLYGSSFEPGQPGEPPNYAVTGNGLLRSSQEYGVELILPSLARVFDQPKLFGKPLGEKMKHVIETRGGYRKVRGIDDFDRYIRFDDFEILSNTEEIDYSLTNRLYVKSRGAVREVMSWQLWQKRYLDPTFGGALVEGQRNTLLTQTEMTAFAFLDRVRRQSPVVSSLLLNPSGFLGIEWRTDYDPVRKRFANSSVTANMRGSKYFVSLGHNQVRSQQELSPAANQLLALIGVGQSDRRGWSAAFSTVYDFKDARFQYATTQVGYNSDCCGFSVQFRRLSYGIRDENQFRVAFAVANIGSFGTLRRQERVF